MWKDSFQIDEGGLHFVMTDTCMRIAKDTFNKAPESTRNGETLNMEKKRFQREKRQVKDQWTRQNYC